MTTGGYEWSNVGIDATWNKCLTQIGEGFDDGRYRQASFEATKGDCVDTITRMQNVPATTGTEIIITPVVPATQTLTFKVWPDRVPKLEGQI